MSVWAGEFRENDAHEELLELIFVVLFLEEDVGHGPDHVEGAVLLRRRRVGVLK